MPMTNPALGRRVLDYAEAHPDEFDMWEWQSACGTRACLAGHALLFSGRGLLLTSGESDSSTILFGALEELGLASEEYWAEAEPYGTSLFYATNNAEALDRFRVLVEKGEAEQ